MRWLGIIGVSGFFLGLVWWLSESPQDTAGILSFDEPRQDAKTQAPAKTSEPAPTEAPAKDPEVAVGPVQPSEDDDSPAALIQRADLMSRASLERAIWSMRQAPRSEVVESIMQAFAASQGHPAERDKVLWLARQVNGPELLSLWTAVLTRESPRALGEDLEATPYPQEPGALAGMEQLEAIGAIAEIPGRESQQILEDVAFGRANFPGLVSALRLDAAQHLQARDRRTLARLAKVLPSDDPLRARLAAWAKAKREEP